MPVRWIDTTPLSFNNLLLLEWIQITWLPSWLPETETAIALKANPAVAWFLRHKCTEIAAWLDQVEALPVEAGDPQAVYAAEQVILRSLNDLLVYAIDPAIYDSQPFLDWDNNELTSLVDFRGQTVIDVGSGTGRLAFTAAQTALHVFAVEPVERLRRYLKEKACRLGMHNIWVVDGLIENLPFPDGFAGVTLGGYVFGDHPENELHELERVTRPGGQVILCPGNVDQDNAAHQSLVAHEYRWGRFAEPPEGWRRKYWKRL